MKLALTWQSAFYFCIMEFGHDPNYFPNPEKFDPTRWLKSDQAQHQEGWFAFGSGTKSCIGNRMGMVCACVSGHTHKIDGKQNYFVQVDAEVQCEKIK